MTSLVQVTVENQEFYLDRILEIERASFSTPWSVNGFLQELENPVAQLWALMSGKALLGYGCFWAVQDEMQVLDLAVHPGFRGQGRGSLLLAKMIDLAGSRGISRIWLEVRASGSSARRLYEKFGFVESGRRKNYYTDPLEDAIVMSLDVTGAAAGNMPRVI
ncbi:MAG: ribosomal protein S18-alanine N-acetyltransferase [Desulfobacterota bacterium]|jgi:ribosomal-protein-alanine N-acetyltransferase|nr:ribosomal protein S18-alanine N-acetyltransferase [Thermodesulfobacteriota bacterium]